MIEKVYYEVAQPVRRSILDALNRQPMYVQELATLLAIERPLVSYHLTRLKKLGVVQSASEVANGHSRNVCSLTATGKMIYGKLTKQ